MSKFYTLVGLNPNKHFHSAEEVVEYYHGRRIDQQLIDELVDQINCYREYLDYKVDFATRDEILEVVHQLNRVRWYAEDIYYKKR